jgi:hypothetical protein
MTRSTFIAALVLLGSVSTPTVSQARFGHLKEWVGKRPTYNGTKPRKEFLKLPEIQQPLLKLLPRNDYRFLTRTCGKEAPIEEADGFLIVRRCHSYACAYGAVILIINLNDGAMHVAIMDEDDTEQRWFSTNGKYRDLPFEVTLARFVTKKAA